MKSKPTHPIWLEVIFDMFPIMIFGVCFIALVSYGVPFLIATSVTTEYKKQMIENAKKSYFCEGIIVKVDSGEDPEYTKWRSKKSKGVSLWLQPSDFTTLHFKDGRVKSLLVFQTLKSPLTSLLLFGMMVTTRSRT